MPLAGSWERWKRVRRARKVLRVGRLWRTEEQADRREFRLRV